MADPKLKPIKSKKTLGEHEGPMTLNDAIEAKQKQQDHRKWDRCACGKRASHVVLGEGVANGCECIECHWRRKHPNG